MIEFIVNNIDNLTKYVFFLLIFIVVRFLIGSIGLFLIAKKRFAKSPYISFIPVVSPFALGALADRSNLKKGKQTNNALTLMLLSIFKTIAYLGFVVTTFFSVKTIILNAAEAIEKEIAMSPDMFKSAVLVIVIFFIAFVLAFIYAVYYYIALFKTYKNEMNLAIAIIVFVFSMLVPFVREITLFILGLAAKENIGFEIE